MKRYEKILVAVGLAPHEEPLTEKAIQIARANGAAVSLLHVFDDGELDRYGVLETPSKTKFLEQMEKYVLSRLGQMVARMNQEGIEASVTLLLGKPSVRIVEHAAAIRADLVMAGASKRVGLRTAVFGTKTRKLIRRLPIDLWIVNEDAPQPKKVLAAVDLRSADPVRAALDRKIIEVAGSVAVWQGGHLHVAHAVQIWTSPFADLDGPFEIPVRPSHEDIRASIEELTNALSPAPEHVDVHLREGLPEEVLPDLVDTLGIDLVVMGTVGRSGLSGFLIGNTAEGTLDNLQEHVCSLLAIKVVADGSRRETAP